MNSRAISAALAAALLLAITACSNGEESAAAAEEAGKPEPAEVASSSPTPEPSEQSAFALGDKADIVDEPNDVSFDATVIAYTQPETGPQPPTEELGGDTWATAEIKVCNVKGQTFSVSQHPWSLAYEDGTRIEVSGLSGGDLPKPEFPINDVSVKPGDCVRGKVPYPVPGDSRPERIVYAPESLDESLEWTIPAE
ncbi:DUF4352 domain-containing protein [Streptomyces albidoflavus]|uniref:DUF4352 domain-containing protein n=1 Tax=Streptomyces albidoflavus TaxID=1886 RepID=UPI00344B908C